MRVTRSLFGGLTPTQTVTGICRNSSRGLLKKKIEELRLEAQRCRLVCLSVERSSDKNASSLQRAWKVLASSQTKQKRAMKERLNGFSKLEFAYAVYYGEPGSSSRRPTSQPLESYQKHLS